MNKEIKELIHRFEDTIEGEPWFGRPVYALLREVDERKAFVRPNIHSHSAIDLLYHMLAWSDFTLNRLEGNKEKDSNYTENIDWREIDPQIHGWEEGVSNLIATNQHILAILATKDDAFLDGKVDFRDYDFRYLLHGMLEHMIYHAGQVAYVHKLMK